ncbi:MAG: carbonic anhydrase [Syntrophomonadaceae bacterium]|nr:carbonic anhydrase [Syntrophomonadaceae bacterium]
MSYGNISAEQALQLLQEGNKRFSSNELQSKNVSSQRRQELLTKGQKPFAVILSCSDSRVPPEVIFDQALGDIFVIRVAGNVVSTIELGSIEYGTEHLQVPLLVILGHDNCGAVKATVDGGEAPGSIGAIVDMIRPSVDKARAAGASGDDLYEQACNHNLQAMLTIVEQSPIIKEMVEHGHLKIVLAKYLQSSGEVVFF